MVSCFAFTGLPAHIHIAVVPSVSSLALAVTLVSLVPSLSTHPSPVLYTRLHFMRAWALTMVLPPFPPLNRPPASAHEANRMVAPLADVLMLLTVLSAGATERPPERSIL